MKVSNKQEQTIYHLLFNIHYNSKIFAIFIDQYGRKTFLEVDDSGNYIYPLILCIYNKIPFIYQILVK